MAGLIHIEYKLSLVQPNLGGIWEASIGFSLPPCRQRGDTNGNVLITAELGTSWRNKALLMKNCLALLSANQRHCYGTIIAAIENYPQVAYFLQCPTDTGKTFLYKCVYVRQSDY